MVAEQRVSVMGATHIRQLQQMLTAPLMHIHIPSTLSYLQSIICTLVLLCEVLWCAAMIPLQYVPDKECSQCKQKRGLQASQHCLWHLCGVVVSCPSCKALTKPCRVLCLRPC